LGFRALSQPPFIYPGGDPVSIAGCAGLFRETLYKAREYT
jgi:hypothetical protein